MHMQNYMFVSKLYNRLLTDICKLSGVSLDAPVETTYKWTHIDGPQLDKQLLMYLEHGGDEPHFPEWLLPLWEEFRLTDDPRLLGYIRQLLTFCYKTEEQPTHEQLRDAQASFEETEAGCGIWTTSFASRSEYNHTLASARRYIGAICYRINWGEITPSHGPGGIYPTRLPRDKSRFTTLYDTIIQKYPFDQYFCGMPNYWHDCMVEESTGALGESSSIVAKLVAVPKDSRGPRLICVHPAESIWIQQGQRQLLERRITTHPLTRGRVNFTDQTVNGKLALLSSKTREFCTLDLKEASDRVSSHLVKSLFGDFHYDWISSGRATHVKLLDGRVMELKKWAPMGNALCFPVESLVFWSLVVAGIESQFGKHSAYKAEVYVFGDDIIVPNECRDVAIRTLVAFGLVPNASKTFSKGFFRESCGVDAYKGVDITPLRLRKADINSLETLVSLNDLALRARTRGYEHCAAFLYKTIRSALKVNYGVYYPIINNKDAGGFFEYQDIPFAELLLREPRICWNKSWHCSMVKRWSVHGQQHVVQYGDWYHLQDSLLRLERKFRSDGVDDAGPSDRPTEYAVPYRSRLKYGWANLSIE